MRRLHGIEIQDLTNEPDPMSLDEEVVIGLVGNFYANDEDKEMEALERVKQLEAKHADIMKAEADRKKAEESRQTAEAARQTAESARETAELERLENYPPKQPDENQPE